MSRRRLLTVYTTSSSDDEHPSTNHSLRRPPPPPSPPPPLEPEDEVFDDVEDDIEELEMEPPPPYYLPSFFPTRTSSTSPIASPLRRNRFVASDCPVNDCLRKMGLCLRGEWLDSCKLGLQNTVPGFSGFDVVTKAKLCFAQALFSDFNCTGGGVLPPNVHEMHLVDLPGPFVLQVDEVINMSCPLKERYRSAPPGVKRCLMLSMTDGVQRVFGMEYCSIPSKTLEALAPAGFKVVIRNVNVRHGLLMLVPELLELLGGCVEGLEAARARLVHEVNKPPRGKRSRTGVGPPLSARATLAAWLQKGVNSKTVPVNGARHIPGNRANSTFHATAPFNGNVQGADMVSRNLQARPNIREATEVLTTGQTDQRSISAQHTQCSIVGEAAQHSNTNETDELPTSREATEPSSRRESTGLSSFSTNGIENQDSHMVDHVEHRKTRQVIIETDELLQVEKLPNDPLQEKVVGSVLSPPMLLKIRILIWLIMWNTNSY